jgi:hypothetical protein
MVAGVMMSHTPGPWNLVAEDGKPRIDINGRMWIEGVGSRGKHLVARVGQRTVDANKFLSVPEEDDIPEQEANARLITAAPDLLTALRDLLAYVESPVHSGRTIAEQDADGDTVPEVRHARAAIAKAEGTHA